jgi:hypothetical protein
MASTTSYGGSSSHGMQPNMGIQRFGQSSTGSAASTTTSHTTIVGYDNYGSPIYGQPGTHSQKPSQTGSKTDSWYVPLSGLSQYSVETPTRPTAPADPDKDLFKGWTNQKAMDVLYTNEAQVDGADGKSDKWGTTDGLTAIATDTGNKYSAELKTAAKYILGNHELLDKLAGDDGLFGAGCDSDPVTAAAHKFMDWGKGHQQDDELYTVSCATDLNSYGGNTTRGFSVSDKKMTTKKALNIMMAHASALDNADGNSNQWVTKAGLQNIIDNKAGADAELVEAVTYIKTAKDGQVWSDLFGGDDLFAVGDFFDAGKAHWQNNELRATMEKYM